MKKIILIVLMSVFVSGSCFSQELKEIEGKDYSIARVGKKIQGVYIFVLTEPYYKYTYVATIKAKMNWSGTVTENFEKVIKKAKKKYPYFNGLIFHKNDLSKADLILFDEDVARGGFVLNQEVTFIEDGKKYTGKIIEFESKKGKASVEYLDADKNKKIAVLKYGDITPLISE